MVELDDFLKKKKEYLKIRDQFGAQEETGVDRIAEVLENNLGSIAASLQEISETLREIDATLTRNSLD